MGGVVLFAGLLETGCGEVSCETLRTCPPVMGGETGAGGEGNRAGGGRSDGASGGRTGGQSSDGQSGGAAGTLGKPGGSASTSDGCRPGTAYPTCSPCAAGRYCPGGGAGATRCALLGGTDHDADPATACVPWTECAAGYEVRAAGTSTSDPQCVPQGWLRELGEPDQELSAVGAATDSMGNLFVGANAYTEEIPDYEVTVLKFSGRDGGVLWSQTFGTDGDDSVTAVAADAAGDLFVLGNTDGVLASAYPGAFLRKVSGKTGQERWTIQIPEAQEAALCVSPEGDPVWAGSTSEEFVSGSAQGGADALVRRVSGKTGKTLWTRQFGTEQSDRAMAVSCGTGDQLVVAGTTEGALAATEPGGMDVFVRKLLAGSGEEVWTTQFGSNEDDWATGVLLAQDGSVIASGETSGALTSAGNRGASDIFMRQLSPDGQTTSATTQFGTTENDDAVGIALLGQEILVAGTTQGSLLGAPTAQFSAFVQTLSLSSGEPGWTEEWSNYGITRASAVAVDSEGAVYLVGNTSGSLTVPTATDDIYHLFALKFVP